MRKVQQTPEYREIIEKQKSASQKQKTELSKKRTALLEKYGFKENKFKDDMTPMQKHFAKQIGIQIAHRMASDIWSAFEKYLWGTGKSIHYKKRGTLTSISNQQFNKHMFYRNNMFIWNGGTEKDKISNKKTKSSSLSIRVKYPETAYEKEMLSSHNVKTLRVVKKWVKTKFKYYLQITLEGTATLKAKHTVKEGRVGLDIGTQSIAIASDRGVHLYELADRVNTNHKRMLYLQRKMDASRRSTNPDNYNPDGTIRRGIKLR